jgi:hypothetical protein
MDGIAEVEGKVVLVARYSYVVLQRPPAGVDWSAVSCRTWGIPTAGGDWSAVGSRPGGFLPQSRKDL